MKKRIRRAALLWLAGALVFTGIGFYGASEGNTVRAENTGEDLEQQIDETNRQLEEAQNEKEDLEQELAALEEKQEDLLAYLEELDTKLSKLEDKIEQNREEIQAKREEVAVLQEQAEAARQEKEDQYEVMKKRIKYMYENGNTGYLELLMGAESLSDLFNRAEYVSKVTSYDQNLFSVYRETCDALEDAQEELEQELDELKSLRKSLKLRKASVETLVEKKEDRLASYEEQLDQLNDEAQAQESMIAAQEAELEQLLEEQRAQIAQEEREREAEVEGTDISNQAAGTDVTGDSASGYRWPLPVSGTISSYFGYRTAPTAGASTYHKGIDIAVPVGTSVLATKAGSVVTATYSSSAGYYVAIYHGDGIYSYYMHCSKLCVSVGQSVSKGQKIALSGNTGVSTGAHLHFAIYANGAYVDPLNYVSQ